MLIKNNDPTTHDRTLWAKVICEVFAQFRDVTLGTDNYVRILNYYLLFYPFSKAFLLKLAVYNPAKGDGFLGNRIKLLKKAAKRIVSNQAIIAQLNANPSEEEQRTPEHSAELVNEVQELVEFLKTADICKDLAIIHDYHKKTFVVRQHYRQSNAIEKLIDEFPRFFDVDGLVNSSETF